MKYIVYESPLCSVFICTRELAGRPYAYMFIVHTLIVDCSLTLRNPIRRDISKVKILVPGAGLGRLTYELAYRGYYCEGNEFSLFMLVASNFVLNKCIAENQYTLYPWVSQYVNNASRKDQTMPIAFPDVSPTKAKPKGGFNMVAGDFLQVSSSHLGLPIDSRHKPNSVFFFERFNHSGVHHAELLGLSGDVFLHRLCK